MPAATKVLTASNVQTALAPVAVKKMPLSAISLTTMAVRRVVVCCALRQRSLRQHDQHRPTQPEVKHDLPPRQLPRSSRQRARRIAAATASRAQLRKRTWMNTGALLAAAAQDSATQGHNFDRQEWKAPPPSAGNCSFPHMFSLMHCNLQTGVPGATTAAACEAAAHAACSKGESAGNVNAWTFTPTLPDPNQKDHCWIGALASLSECYITPAADGWVGAADFTVSTTTSCPANSTCMANAYSSTNLGCCRGYGTNAVACPDHVHCCPEGWSSTAQCGLGQCGCVPPPQQQQQQQQQQQ